MIYLKLCPACGKHPAISWAQEYAYIQCVGCGTSGRGAFFSNYEDIGDAEQAAGTFWNDACEAIRPQVH